jgi:transcriptional regulator with XRE-family HTH domain
MHATPEQSATWLRFRMAELGITSLEELAELCGSDKGNLSRIFRQQQRPRVDALEPLAAGLQVGVYEVLVRIGAVDPDDDTPPVVTKAGQKVTFTWPRAGSRPLASAGAGPRTTRR